ncbi:MAG: tRNA uridine-5-carboxymethylaminomethyl(34) synthesis GTPase MnmE [Flavobacteriales bacterium]|nr:tRNA uridine-5-carboxymethylaminomethyl(34) synthesis GTPase MnmE [Flavobacteriales bacterium]
MNSMNTICALSTPNGSGAIGVIRLSGSEAINICNQVFEGKDLSKQKGQTLHFGKLLNGADLIDEVLVSLFKGPNSYTGEDVIEISCHGSSYILMKVLELLLEKGAQLAAPGEFTMRAFMNGKMDLAQAEAVADLIASESKAAHDIAMNQMRGGFSEKIAELRHELIQFTSLIELELDFAEEDVEFADRDDLKALVNQLLLMIQKLVASFSTGNALKNGIPVAIVGQPNVGKSTLLNALLNEDKAIVSEIAGTTRDSIEDTVNLGGLTFRFIDTAGIRETEDVIEKIGIQRTYLMVEKAMVILYLVDAVNDSAEEVQEVIQNIKKTIEGKDKQLVVLANKIDKGSFDANKVPSEIQEKFPEGEKVIYLSALQQTQLDQLTDYLKQLASDKLKGSNEVIVSNARHHQALKQAGEALDRVKNGLESNITGDFLAMDIRQALHFLGEITGTIEIDRDILGNIFSQFCIGK